MLERRLSAYILPGDPVWLEKSLRQYYPFLADLVIPVPSDGRGWKGQPVPVDAVLRVIDRVDIRGISRQIEGRWRNAASPIRAETAQRQAAIDACAERADWILQIDNDEYLPRPEALWRAIGEAEKRGLDAVEWPMRVLYRRTGRWVFEVVTADGRQRHDYPGPVAVRPGVQLVDARRTPAAYLRPTVRGDNLSLQLARDAEEGEHRWAELEETDAIVHNSWARSPAEVWHKTRSWGHAQGIRTAMYYVIRWLPSPWTWRFVRQWHPFAHGLWPRLDRRPAHAEGLSE